MPDVDDDGIPDAYDNDTLWGFISGINKVGVPITIAIVIDVVGTDEDGYYAFGPLEEGDHVIVPEPTDNNTWFAPRFEIMAP
jgi:hypothetical protein